MSSTGILSGIGNVVIRAYRHNCLLFQIYTYIMLIVIGDQPLQPDHVLVFKGNEET